METQSTNTVLMISPVAFNYNEQTSETNSFQQKPKESNLFIQQKALQEFNDLVNVLTQNGVIVKVVEDTLVPHTPDSIFPNNWFSTHDNGPLVLYPMQSANRQLERREDIIGLIKQNTKCEKLLDLSYFEYQNLFLEGTGSLVLDRINKIAFVAISPRADITLVQYFCEKMGYEACVFTANDAQNKPIYHTNVMMCMGTKFAVICTETIRNKTERQNVLAKIHKTGRQIIEITMEQMNNFAGNMLELNVAERYFVAMSSQAFNALNEVQKSNLEQYATIIHSDISTIEHHGGGSVRCMLGEVFVIKD